MENVVVRFAERVTETCSEPQQIAMANNLAEECNQLQNVFSGISMTIPEKTSLRMIADLDDYYCLYPEITVSKGKGSSVRISWSEALYNAAGEKTDRDLVDGKYFVGLGNSIYLDGECNRKYSSLWWHAGRFMELIIKTGEEPLTLENICLTEVHYPYKLESSFKSDSSSLDKLIPMSLKTLKMCSHEIFMDCPFYEQKNYIGDSLVESLISYTWCLDDRLPRKTIASYKPAEEFIPNFRLWWIGMVYDYAMWRGDNTFIASLMPSVRNIIDQCFTMYVDDVQLDFLKKDLQYEAKVSSMAGAEIGLLKVLPGWHYIDLGMKNSQKEWKYGAPDDDGTGINCVYNLLVLHSLRMAAELEAFCGEFEMKSRYTRYTEIIKKGILKYFYDQDTGLFSYYITGGAYSEHAQSLAIISNAFESKKQVIAKALLNYKDLTRTNIFFTHHLFEAYYKIQRVDVMLQRLDAWVEMQESGYRTVPEEFGPNRSDCHAWGAFAPYHYLAAILGIRPGSMGFGSVVIAPDMGSLKHASGEMVHKCGKISVDITIQGDMLNSKVILPPGLSGEFLYKGKTLKLKPGENEIII